MLSTPCNAERSKRLLSVELSNYKKLEMRDDSKPEETKTNQIPNCCLKPEAKMKGWKAPDWTRECLAEILGTGILLCFGTGSVAQAVLSGRLPTDMLSINIGWAAGVILGVLASATTSGAHLNPAVTVAQAVVGKFSWKKVPHYLLSQYIGAFLGSGLTLLTYRENILDFAGGEFKVVGEKATAGIFVTFPKPGLSNFSGAIDQIVGTALLTLCIAIIGNPRNSKIVGELGPFLVGLTVLAIGVCFGDNAGYAINPARDLGPRILLLLSGYGTEAFSASEYWFWIPVVCCHFGGILGYLIHILFIDALQPKQVDSLE